MPSSNSNYHHGNLPQALLQATCEALAEQGAGKLSLRDVARRAGVSHAAPAHHFGDKAGLLTALATQGFQLFYRAMSEARDGGGDDSLSRLSDCGVAYVMFAVAHPEHFQVMFQPGLRKQDDPDCMAAAARAYAVLTGAIADAQADGHGAGRDIETLAIASWSTVHGLATLWLGGSLGPKQRQQDVAALARRVLGQHLRSW